MTATVISFYTPEWRYAEFAKNLQEDCKRLGLPCLIEVRESRNSYVKNCNIKPEYIKEKLLELKSPVIWIDVDGSIIKLPQLMIDAEIAGYDIAANQSINNPDHIHVGSFFLNYSPKVLEFLDSWIQEIKRKNGIDDGAFNAVWNRFKHDLKYLKLPDNYFVILPWPDTPPSVNAVIVHRLSSSDLKLEYKRS